MPFHFVVTSGEDGHRIFYELLGEQDAMKVKFRILFTMGLGGDSTQWEPQIEHFSNLPGYQICVYDNRGAGFSDPVQGRWTTKAMSKDAISLLNSLGWRDNVHLVGVSMGGMITQEIALLDEKRFVSMTLLCTIAGGLQSLYLFAKVLPSGIRLLVRAFTASSGREQLKAGMAVLFPTTFLHAEVETDDGGATTNFHIFRKALIRRGVKNLENGMPRTRMRTFVKQVLAVSTHRVPHATLNHLGSKFENACLVITGDEDILVHKDNSALLARELGCHLMTIPGAGHGVSEQCADKVNSAIQKLIESQEKGIVMKSNL